MSINLAAFGGWLRIAVPLQMQIFMIKHLIDYRMHLVLAFQYLMEQDTHITILIQRAYSYLLVQAMTEGTQSLSVRYYLRRCFEGGDLLLISRFMIISI